MSSLQQAASSSRPHTRRPKDTDFLQQRLKAQHPVITPKPFIITCIVIGIIFIPIGAYLLYSSNGVIEMDVEYSKYSQCDVGNVCYLTITLPSRMPSPVYFYYRLDGYYQNHRRYVASRNDQQLSGKQVSAYGDLIDCDPHRSVNDSTDPKDFYYPCGAIAQSMFNDTFILYKDDKPVPWQRTGIAWETDRKNKFNNPPPGTPGVRVIADLEDEDFIVWMRLAALPDFKKLYRIVNMDLEGNVTVKITSNYPVHNFGSKWIAFSTMSWIGGKNPFMGYTYIIVGALALLQGVIFAIKQVACPRPLGDISYLHWD